jgi:hypothetical protein
LEEVHAGDWPWGLSFISFMVNLPLLKVYAGNRHNISIHSFSCQCLTLLHRFFTAQESTCLVILISHITNGLFDFCILDFAKTFIPYPRRGSYPWVIKNERWDRRGIWHSEGEDMLSFGGWNWRKQTTRKT